MVRRFFCGCLHFILCLVEAFLWVLGAWIAAGWWGWRSDRIEILCAVLALLEEGKREIFVRIMWYVYVNIDGSYPDILIILHTFACSFEVLSIAEKLGIEDGGVTYCTLYFI